MSFSLKALLAPQQNACHLCGALLRSSEHTLCGGCWQRLARGRVPAIDAVSRTYEPIALALSAYWHQDDARALVHLLKFKHDRAAALPLALGMSLAYGTCLTPLPPPDGVVAVPVDPARLRERGYNQAELLAQAFCQQTDLCYLPDALLRRRHTRSQIWRSQAQRLSAMEGVFAANRSFDGLRILLVDDVLTTGATATACARCLLAAGAAQVFLLTACKA